MVQNIDASSQSRHKPATLPTLIDAATANDRDAPFLLCTDRDWTYGQFSDAVDNMARGLVSLDIKLGDRIAIAAPNSAQWLITWFAAAKIGAVLVTLNVAYRDHEFDYMLNQSGAVMIVCAARDGEFNFVEFLDHLRPQIPTVRHFVFIDADSSSSSFSYLHWDDVPASADDDSSAPRPAVDPAHPAVILYTSGTTGHPKGATLTHGSILASAQAQIAHLAQRADDVTIGHMPLNHVGGMTCTVAAAMVAGSKVALLPRYSPTTALQAIARHRVTIFNGVPTMYAMMMGLPAFADANMSSVRTCVIGGSNVEPALAQRIIDAFPGARLANLYGLSETSGGCIMSAAGDDVDTLVSTLGVPIGGFQVRITDDAHHPLPVGSEGELEVRGTCVASGYWQSPDESAETFLSDGWLATGDIGVLRADGRVTLRGRKKEMYVRSGYNVYPVEIENLLAQQKSVAMSAVIGIPDDLYGEVGHAFVLPASGHDVNLDALYEVCAARLAKYKIPAKIIIVDALPLTPSGKIRKALLRTDPTAP
ncbi:class I adenylate-forming enzyme family protein (plasmid) [Rhodococcoides fascians]|uniref:class I adenylate-forming enzyme family protein n=1 Tax=Rhodococcoides fascians TaxID=1828 RepID=UPI00389AB6AC